MAMLGSTVKKARLVLLVAGISVLAGWDPGVVISPAYASMEPSMPMALRIPSTPIVAQAQDTALGYLPGSGEVSAQGQYTYSIPIEVPAGRGGMQPSLALSYSSSAGSGILGVGWSLSGTSSISRCVQTLSTDGQVQGVHLTDSTATGSSSDRFCLDGKKLVAINGVYGQVGTEYRTEEDSYAQIVSSLAPGTVAQAANEPMFTVRVKGGKTLTYTALYGTPIQSALNGPGAATGTYKTAAGTQAIVSWVLSSEVDAAGNGIQYNYCAVTPSSNTCPATVPVTNPAVAIANPPSWLAHYPAMTQWKLSSIVYTTAADGSDAGQRKVVFSYENLPAGVTPEYRFQAGVATGVFQRLTKIIMVAPDPGKALPVWQYDIIYNTSSFSNRSLLNTVRRCALNTAKDPSGGVEGGCMWAKEFDWTTSPTGPIPQWNNWKTLQASGTSTPTFTIGGLFNTNTSPQTDINPNVSPNVNPPVLQVLDVDGDGKDDVMLQYGGPTSPTMSLITSPNSPAGPLDPGLVLSSWMDPMVHGNYLIGSDPASGDGGEREALQNVLPMDIDGDGSSEIYVTQATFTGTTDPTSGTPDVVCQPRVMHWDSVKQGFYTVALSTPLPSYDCTYDTNANKEDLFLDLDGDGRLDHVQSGTVTFNTGVYSGPHILVPGAWDASQLNANNAMGASTTLPGGIWAACPTYVVDFSGEGRGQLFGLTGYAYGPTTATPTQPANVICGADTGYATALDRYSAVSNQWQETTESDPPADTGYASETNPSLPIIPATTFAPTGPANPGDDGNAIPGNATSAPGLGTAPTLIFGDFNGDGLEDVIEPDQDPANVGKGMYWLRWNTGNGFGPRIALPLQTWAQANPNAAQNGVNIAWTQYTPTFFRVFVSDLNHDGRADLIVFSNYPSSQITLLLSNGDGTFTASPMNIGLTGPPWFNGDAGVYTYEGSWVVGIGDFDGDGYTDVVQAEPLGPNWSSQMAQLDSIQSTPAVLQVSLQEPSIADRVQSVFDEATVWPREQVTYALSWSDKPEPVTPCTYPQRCQNRGSVVVREVDYRDTLVNPSLAQVNTPHAVYYSYEDPVADMRGRGNLGFRKVREWDPTQLSQTITEYDNRTEAAVNLAQIGPAQPLFQTGQNYYPGVMRPQQVTSVTVIPAAATPQTVPTLPRGTAISAVNARVVQTRYTYQSSSTNGGLTYVVQPQQQVTTESEQQVQMAASVLSQQDPTSDYLWSPAAPYVITPTNPLRISTTQIGGPNTCNNGAPASGIDAYGNVLQSTSSIQGGITNLECSTYTNDPSTWQIGLLQSSSVTATDGSSSVERGARYDYDSHGLLAHQYELRFASPSDTGPTTISTTTLGRDSYGNVTSVAIQAIGPDGQMDTRQVNTEYDALWPGQPNERIFPSQQWVSAPYPGTSVLPSTWSLVHPAYGVVSARMDINGVQAATTYDDQGRIVQSVADGQAPVTMSYAGRWDTYYGQNGLVVTTTMAGQVTTVSGDADGRELGTTHLGFDGTLINDTYITYDLLGRMLSASRPYAGSAPGSLPPTGWPQTTYTYDGLNRRLIITGPDSTTQQPVQTTITPAFFITTMQDPNGNQHRVVNDVNGRMVSSADLLTGAWVGSQYTYVAFNQLAQVIDPNGNVESTVYDTLGRPGRSVSLDTGTTVNSYDNFGELLSSTHQQSGAVTTFKYDALGRQTQSQTIDGATTTSAAFTYDTQPYGLGKLATATSSDGVTTVAHYDSDGRSTGTDQTIGGHTYSTSMQYNTLGQVSQLNYPAIGNGTAPGIALPYTYTATGYLSEVDYNENASTPSPLPPLWRVAQRNWDDALVQGEFGNGVSTIAGKGTPAKITQTGVLVQNTYVPSNGRLQQMLATPTNATPAIVNLSYGYYPNGLVQTRTDAVNGRQESFQYDSLKRLTNWNLATASCPAVPCSAPTLASPYQMYGYDNTGNLLQVSQYNGSGWAVAQSNSYGASGAGPHALTSQSSAGGTAVNYGYDTHGRQTAGAGRKLLYNAYNLPKTVAYNNNTWTLLYDAFGNRVQKSGSDGTTVYVGGLYEKRTTAAGVLDVFHVPGGQLQYSEATGATSLYGEFTDALGSVGTVFNGSPGTYSGVAGTPGTTVSTFFYEPFGARTTQNGSAFTGVVGNVTEGFTGQEHDDDWGLINFRGRLYNPTLKRFMSGDPHVTSPGFSQSWNPYSYVYNSPLNFTDPTGFDGDGDGGSAYTPPPPPAPITRTGVTPDGIPYTWQEDANGNEINGTFKTGFAGPDTTTSGVPLQSTDAGYIPSLPSMASGNAGFADVPPCPTCHGVSGNPEPGHFPAIYDESTLIIPAISYAVLFRGSLEVLGPAASYALATGSTAGRAIGLVESILAGQAGLPSATAPILASAAAVAAANASKPGCFVAGTLVQTDKGSKPIESIKVGDLVAARDETTGATTYKPVLQLIHHENQEIVNVTIGNNEGQQEVIQATLDHPFHVSKRGWVKASDLKAGDRVDRLKGNALTVRHVERDAQRHATYNFEVQDVHTYFVGALRAWVHNENECVKKAALLALENARSATRVAEALVSASEDIFRRASDARLNAINTPKLDYFLQLEQIALKELEKMQIGLIDAKFAESQARDAYQAALGSKVYR
jgi:RHS repeat-associated protein